MAQNGYAALLPGTALSGSSLAITFQTEAGIVPGCSRRIFRRPTEAAGRDVLAREKAAINPEEHVPCVVADSVI